MRKLLTFFCLLLALSIPAQAAWTKIDQCANTANVCSLTNTGSNLIILTFGTNGGGIPTPSGSLGNIFTQVPITSTTSVMYYCIPTVFGAETYGVLALNGASFNVGISVVAVSGAATSGLLNGSSAGSYVTSTTAQPGSITPTYTNVLVVTSNAGHSTSGATPTVDSGFAVTLAQHSDGTGWSGAGLAYKVMATPSAINPTWTAPDGSGQSSVIAAFLASDSTPVSTPRTRHRVIGGE